MAATFFKDFRNMLNKDERLLVLRYQDRLSRRKIISVLNKGRKTAGQPLLPINYSYRLQVVPPSGSKSKHPLDYFLECKWKPNKVYPLSVDYIRLYGEDYLLGYLDGYEGLTYGESVETRSESYARSYVDGLLAAASRRVRV